MFRPLAVILVAVLGFNVAAPTGDAAQVALQTSPASDRVALSEFFEAGGGPEWLNSDNWNSPAPLDQWYGITTNDVGRVAAISLVANRLQGQITPAIDQLQGLEALDLSDNQLRGAVPLGLGRLPAIKTISLANNRFSGSIPSALGAAPLLEVLDLSGNQLVAGIPDQFYRLSSLKRLDLSRNRLIDRVRSELATFADLTYLDLSQNGFHGPVPASLGNLQNLESLLLAENSLTGEIPAEYFNIANLAVLDLSGNRLNGRIRIPGGPPTRLQRLDLSGNNITGPLPGAIARFDGLQHLDLSNNVFRGPVPSGLAAMTDLRVLRIGGNRFSGLLPWWVGRLVSLTELRAGGNQLTGPIPDLSALAGLAHLDLGGNSLSGPIPAWLAVLPSLELLDLSSNSLAGPPPRELAGLSRIVRLALGGNPLTGAIPGWLGELESLEDLDLSDANLTGPIPGSMQSLANLRWIDLGGNQVTGPIPPWFGDFSGLQYLRLSANALSGPIPPNLFSAAELQVLELDNNRFSDAIPDRFDGLPLLARLRLNDNQLSGPIPDSLGRSPRISSLHLDGNRLSGEIPGWLPDLDAISDLRLGRNQLSGNIPDDIGRLRSLLELGIEGNLLTGPVPESIGSIPGLLSLDLSGNQLDGQIPASLALLTELEHLDLGDNRLGGSIPAALGDLGRMRWLNLAHNRLEGLIPEELGQLSRLRELYLEGNSFEGCAPTEIRGLRSTISLHEFGGRPFCDLALSLISVSPGQIRPEFDSAHHDYVVDVPALESSQHVSIRLFAYQELQAVAFLDAYGRILADADDQAGGFQLDISELTAGGLPPLMSVEVISGDLKYRYGLRFSPSRAGEARLYAVLVDGRPTFASVPTGEFSRRVGFEERTVRIEALALDAGAAVTVSPPDADQEADNGHQVDLAVGANSLLIEVTSADGESRREIELILKRLPPDRDTLVRLYEATGGPAWYQSGGWLSEDPLGDWYGVSTDSAGRVVELELGENGLTGPLPAVIADLDHLRNLDLRKNRLTGEIPSEFAQLSELVILELSGNRLSGPLPDHVAQLPELLLLSLDENELSGPIPTAFANAAELIALGLGGNEFTGPVPESLGNLPALGTLRLAGNRLEGCLPTRLRSDVLQYHDFARLGLTFCDVGIRALPLNLGRLLPAFSPGNTRYRLFLGADEVSAQLSLAPELFSAGSEVNYLGPDHVPLVDADPRTDGFQVNMSRLPTDGSPFELSIRVSSPAAEQEYSFAIELSQPGEVGLEAIGVAGLFSNYSIGSSYLRRLVNHQSERITIEPRTIDPEAEFEFLSPPDAAGGPRPLPDADGQPGNGFQLDTASGPNILLLRVQSADSSRVRIYALVIVRTPGKPSPPSITTVQRSPGRTELYWNAPELTGGSPISGYDLRYIYAGTPEKSDRYWTMIGRLDPGAGLNLVLDALEDDLSYEFQIRARNRAGAGSWSGSFASDPIA